MCDKMLDCVLSLQHLCRSQIRALQAEHYKSVSSQDEGTGDGTLESGNGNITQDTDRTDTSHGMGTDAQAAMQQQVILC